MLIDSIQYLVTGDALTIGDDVTYVLELFKRGVSIWITSFTCQSDVLNGSVWEAPMLPSGEFVRMDADEFVVIATDVELDRQVFRIDGSEFYIPLTGAGVTEENRFDLPPTYTLTLSAEGSGVTSPAPGTYTYNEGDSVTVTAIPDAGFAFLNWLKDEIVLTTSPLTFTVWDNISLQAIFEGPVVVEAGFDWRIPAAVGAVLGVAALFKGRKR